MLQMEMSNQTLFFSDLSAPQKLEEHVWREVRDWKVMGMQSWGHSSVTHRLTLVSIQPALGPSTEGTQASKSRGWSRHVFFCCCWECWWGWEVSANPQRILEICFSWMWPDQPARVGLLVMWLVVFQERQRLRKIVLRAVPVGISPRHARCPVSGNCFYLLHDKARLRGHTRWGPLRQGWGVLR